MLTERRGPPPGLGGTSSRSRAGAIFRLLLRYVRRPLLLVILIGISVFFGGLMLEWITSLVRPRRPNSDASSQANPVYSVEDLILTVTKTHTAFIRSTTTKTVVVPEASGLSTSFAPNRLPDAFGFPIYANDENPAAREALSTSPDASTIPESKHFWRKDGLLEVHPDGPHPIFELITKAERDWKAKHDRASKTLKEACVEYERRYGRKPPHGFQKWWAYVQKHSVPLPDEYDQIHRDLEPLWAIEPLQLQWIQYEWEAHADSFTIGKDELDSGLELLNHTMPDSEQVRHELAKGANMMIDLLKDVAKELPVFRAVFSPHDNPTLMSDWELRKDAIEAAKRGEYLDLTRFRDHKLHGWKSACPPLSPIWLEPIPYSKVNGVTTAPTLQQIEKLKFASPNSNYSSLPEGSPYPKTFIYDHAASLSPCDHPSHILTHGNFLAYGSAGPVPLRATLREPDENGRSVHYGLTPLFSYSPTRLHDDIVTAFPLQWVQDVYPREDDPPFDEKPDSRLHWRGRNTGIWCGNDEDAMNMHRAISKIAGEYDPEDKATVGLDRSWWLAQRGRLVDWANRIWEGRDETGTSSVKIGVPHEIWKRSVLLGSENFMIGDPAGDNATSLHGRSLGKGNVRSAVTRGGVLRSTPSIKHRLRVAPDEDNEGGIAHESEPLIKSDWAPAMCDVAFAGSALNCQGRMCDKVDGLYEFRKVQGSREQGRYKFVIDVDGNGWSSRFKRLITSNSLIFKSTVYPEWFTDRVQPWLHYVPVQVDYSDLLDILYFFRGDPSQHNAHMDLASKIAQDGRHWSQTYWRKEDMVAYMYRLFMEYARVLGDETGKRQDYIYKPEDEHLRWDSLNEKRPMANPEPVPQKRNRKDAAVEEQPVVNGML